MSKEGDDESNNQSRKDNSFDSTIETTSLETKINDLEAELTKKKLELAELKDTTLDAFEEIKAENKNLEQQLQEERRFSKTTVEALESEVNKYKERMLQLGEERDQSINQVEQLKEYISSNIKQQGEFRKINDLKDENDKLQEQVNKYKREQEIRNQSSNYTDIISALNNGHIVETLSSSDPERLKIFIKEAFGDYEELENKIEQLNQELQKQTEVINNVNKEKDSLQQNFNEQKIQNKDLRKSNNDLQEDLTTQSIEQQSKIRELEKQNKTLEKKLKETIDQLEAENLNEKLAQQNKSFEELILQKDQLEESIPKGKSLADELKEPMDELEKKIKELTTQNAELQKKIDELQKANKELEKQNKSKKIDKEIKTENIAPQQQETQIIDDQNNKKESVQNKPKKTATITMQTESISEEVKNKEANKNNDEKDKEKLSDLNRAAYVSKLSDKFTKKINELEKKYEKEGPTHKDKIQELNSLNEEIRNDKDQDQLKETIINKDNIYSEFSINGQKLLQINIDNDKGELKPEIIPGNHDYEVFTVTIPNFKKDSDGKFLKQKNSKGEEVMIPEEGGITMQISKDGEVIAHCITGTPENNPCHKWLKETLEKQNKNQEKDKTQEKGTNTKVKASNQQVETDPIGNLSAPSPISTKKQEEQKNTRHSK